MRDHDYWVYILTNKRCTILYIGITNNIVRRLSEQRQGEVGGFTEYYQANRLFWVEHFREVRDALGCENTLKGWCRGRKIAFIEQTNPRWLHPSDDWERKPRVYDRPWDTDEMIQDSSRRSK